MVAMERHKEVMGAGLNGIILMTLSDPNPVFKVYLEVEYLKNGAF